MPKKAQRKSITAKPPAKRRGQWHTFGPLRVKYVRSRRQLVVSLLLPKLPHRTKLRSAKPTPPGRLHKLVSYSFTAWLLILCGISIAAIVRPLPASGPHVQAAKTETAPIPPAATKPLTLSRSLPTQLQIPTIGVKASLEAVGLKADGTIAIPAHFDTASWYTGSPTPGELGPAVIVGHLDSIYGAAVFYNLKKLQPNDQIWVTRQDGKTAIFKVDKLELFPQNAFPTQAVYGNINYAGLRLITCGGDFNYFTRHYSHNVVVYASLVSG